MLETARASLPSMALYIAVAPRGDPVNNFAFVRPRFRRTKVAKDCLVENMLCEYWEHPWAIPGDPMYEPCMTERPRLSNHFCPQCGSRFIGWLYEMTAYNDAL